MFSFFFFLFLNYVFLLYNVLLLQILFFFYIYIFVLEFHLGINLNILWAPGNLENRDFDAELKIKLTQKLKLQTFISRQLAPKSHWGGWKEPKMLKEAGLEVICLWCKLLYAQKKKKKKTISNLTSSKTLEQTCHFSAYTKEENAIWIKKRTSFICMYIHKISSNFKMYDSTNTLLKEQNGKQNYTVQGWKTNNYNFFHWGLIPYKTSANQSLLLLSFFFAHTWK